MQIEAVSRAQHRFASQQFCKSNYGVSQLTPKLRISHAIFLWMSIPSFKDAEVLNKHAAKLCVAFLAIACILQPLYQIPHWILATLAWLVAAMLVLPDISATLVILVSAAAWAVFWAACCSFLLWIVWIINVYVSGYSWMEWIGQVLLPFIGLSFLSMGALGLCKAAALQPFGIHDPLPHLNLFWELGFFTYGLWCLQVFEKSQPKQ